jgi:thiamine biosynthesis lipoprotein
MKKLWIISLLVISGILLITMGRNREFSSTEFIMDTLCEIKVTARRKPTRAITEAFEIMQRVDSIASFEGVSEIARLNQGEDIELSREIVAIIEEGIKASKLTHGAFDITIRPLMELWQGFREEHVPTKEKIAEVIPLVGFGSVSIVENRVVFKEEGMGLDLSGIAKGYAIDLAVERLKECGIKAGLVNAGGDIRVFGEKTWKIGIKDPRGSGILKTLELTNEAVATSGDYEKYFMLDTVRYHHILNPWTGMPASECVSVTVVSDQALLADAIATGVFVLGEKKGKALLDSLQLRGVIVTKELDVIECGCSDYLEIESW